VLLEDIPNTWRHLADKDVPSLETSGGNMKRFI